MKTLRSVIGSDGSLVCTAAEWQKHVTEMRTLLNLRGVERGDRVVVWLPRGIEEAFLYRAVFEMGAVWVSVPRRLTASQVDELVADVEPRIAICGQGEMKRFRPGCWIEIPEMQPTDFINGSESLIGDADELAAICYTSGSTGRPKGVMVSSGNLSGAVDRVDGYLRHHSSDRLLALMPLNAPWGLIQWMLAERAGASIVLPPPVAMAAELVKTIRAAGVTGLAALPPTWVQLVDCLLTAGETLPGLRYVTTSGGVVPARILEAFPLVFPSAQIWMTYGLTEAFRTTVVPASEFSRKKGSLGKPCDPEHVEILLEDGTRAGPGEIGELVHRGSCVTLGYWRRSEATSSSYQVRPGHGALLGNGPVHYSGDRVWRDEEGYLWFEGRNDDLIKTGGYRVSADEVEDAMLAVAGVMHAVVGGGPDEVLGQRIIAVITTTGDGPEVLSAVKAALRRTLASYQQPHVFHVWVGAVPLTANGKIDRKCILQHVLSGLRGGDAGTL